MNVRPAEKTQPDIRERNRGSVTLDGVTKTFNEVVAVRDIHLNVPSGSFVSLVGPSGCGKTTTLRMVAGLEKPDGGSIYLDDRLISGNGVFVPPEARGMGMVFQSYALWPHMSVFENVAFSLKLKRLPRREVQELVDSALQTVGMAGYGDRFPSQLSGGQQQRVALARALASQPKVLLFDEPLSNLDAALRESMRFEIRDVQQRLNITSIYVTHSQDEALTLSDAIAVMADGEIKEQGTPEEIYQRPRTRFVAKFIGLANILDAEYQSRSEGGWYGRVVGSDTPIESAVPPRRKEQAETGARLSVLVRPENIQISRAATSNSRREPSQPNVLVGVVKDTRYIGSIIDYLVDIPGCPPVRVQATPPIVASPGDKVDLRFGQSACVPLVD